MSDDPLLVYFGSPDDPPPDWREEEDEQEDDDEELEDTPLDVVKMLGFDPADARAVSHTADKKILTREQARPLILAKKIRPAYLYEKGERIYVDFGNGLIRAYVWNESE